MVRSTRTVATLSIPHEAYSEIRGRVVALGPDHEHMLLDYGIDMTGVALVPEKSAPPERDVPHWATAQVAADREMIQKAHGGDVSYVTDRMIYARLLEIGVVAPGDETGRMLARDYMLALIEDAI